MGNLGKATLKVKVTPFTLTGLIDATASAGRESFDFNVADDFNQIANDHEYPPRNVEVIRDEHFAVMHPAKRVGEINNRMNFIPSAGGAAADAEIIWNQLPCKRSVFNGCPHLQNLIQTTAAAATATTVATSGTDNDMSTIPANGLYAANYKGPEWRVNFITKSYVSQADDQVQMPGTTVDAQASPPGGSNPPVAPTAATGGILDDHVAVIEQRRIFDGIWWGAQTDPHLDANIPFYLKVRRDEPRNFVGQPSCLIVRINPPSLTSGNTFPSGTSPALPGQSLDIVFENGKIPRLYDWSLANNPPATGATTTASSGNSFTPLQTDLTNLGATQISGEMTIGFLPVLGNLNIYLNNRDHLYHRRVQSVDQGVNAAGAGTGSPPGASSFAYTPFTTKIETIKVYATNCSGSIAIAAMRFANGLSTLPFSGRTNPTTGATDLPWGTGQEPTLTYNPGDPTNNVPPSWTTGASSTMPPIYKLPQAESPSSNSTNNTAYGVSVASMAAGASITDPVVAGINHKGYGGIQFFLGPTPPVGTVDQTRNYQALMFPEKKSFISTPAIPASGTAPAVPAASSDPWPIVPPFLQRLRGSATIASSLGQGAAQIAYQIEKDVISLSESWSSPDRIMTTHTVDITLYNDQGQYDFLLQQCCGVVVELGWDTAYNSNDGGTDGVSPTKVFTGASYGGSSSVQAGKEVVTIQCQDYMAVLEHFQMINSPYYDGMDIFDAVKDLTERGRVECVDDTDVNNRYYLPSGYSWTQPRLRFTGQSSIKDNLGELVKMGERVAFFDESGILHLAHLQGGLFGQFTGPTTSTLSFRRKPNITSPVGSDFHVMLNERKIDYKLASAVNSVQLRTVDRLQGAVYIINRKPNSSTPSKFPYKKQLMVDQPALGSVAAANYYADQLIERFSKTPKGMTFNTILAPHVKLRPTDIIRVTNDDGSHVLMRVQTISRQYEAESNSLETSLTCEWYDDSAAWN